MDRSALARPLPVLPLVVLALTAAGGATAAEVTPRGLLEEMIDLERLAEAPDPPFTTRQFSSYDRASRSASEGEQWFANADQGKYLREEIAKDGRKEYVMMEAEGPGVIVRIWSADPKGTLRIYLDGAEEPALAAPMADLLGGKVKPFVAPLACETSRGYNLYFPIAYRSRCKVTGDAAPFYYHVNYRTYPAGTPVEGFAAEKLAGLQAEIDRVAEALRHPEAVKPSFKVAGKLVSHVVFGKGIPPGETRPLFKIDKGGAIRELRLAIGPNAEPELYRKCVLVGRFDGEPRPSIWAPLGDFFGSAPGVNPYASLPLGVLPDGEMYCRWAMPFEREAFFEIQNTSDREVTARGSYLFGPQTFGERSLRFHARFRVEHDLATRPMRDWTFLDCKGPGVFVGAALSVANPVKAWWGEGDEKIYVDGETFPSHFGTGTEDYFGYAWSSNQLFQHAYHNQTRADGPANYGQVSVNRWHIVDRIPFNSSFKFDMEVWHWNANCKVTFAATSYWYARPGGTDTAPEFAAADLRIPELPELKTVKVEGAIEGEKLRVLARKGVADSQDMEPFEGPWSGGAQLWWREGRPGDELKLEFPAPKAGRYRVTAAMTKAIDYGIHQLSINGAGAGKPIDFFNDGVIHTGPVDLGVFELLDGANVLSVTIVGTNPAARPKNYMFGLDYLLLKPE